MAALEPLRWPLRLDPLRVPIAAPRPASTAETGLPDWPRSEELLALARRENAQHLPVFGDGSSRDLNAVSLGEKLDDLLVGQGDRLVFLVDDLLDGLLDALACDVFVGHAPDGRVEEVLELEEALRRVDVLVGRDAADGRLVHADGLGHVAQDHRLEVSHALLEEVALLVDDALGHPDDRLAPLLDGTDQPLRVAELLADELLGLRVLEELLGERLVDVEALHAPVVVGDDELVAVLDDVDVRRDRDGLVVGVREVSGRAALELLDLLDRLVHLFDRHLQVARDRLIVVLLEVT